MKTKNIKLPCTTKPCNNCPMRKDSLKGWLGKARMTEILNADSFSCHKTTDGRSSQRLQCSGHMLITRERNAFYRLATRLIPNFEKTLKGSDLVFGSVKEAIKHHSY